MQRKLSSESNPADWFVLAEDRIHAADTLWRGDGLSFTGIEILQEAVERYLKGYPIANGWKLERIHDLPKLLRAAIKLDPAFKQFESMAEELTDDFFAQHYPGGDWSTVGSNYETLRRQAGEMIELIRRHVPQHFPPPADSSQSNPPPERQTH